MRQTTAIAISLLLCATLSAQVERLTVKRGEIAAITCKEPGTVKWIVFHPVELQYLTLFNQDGQPVLVFTPPSSAKQAAIEALTVDWDAKTLNSKRWVVTFEGDTPVPPGPDPGPGPEPKPPTPPDNVPDGYLGLTKLVASYDVAPHSSLSHRMAAIFAEVADGLAPGDQQKPPKFGTIEQAMAELKRLNTEALTADGARTTWLPVLTAIDAKIKSAWPLTRYQMADALRAVSAGMEYLK